MSQSRQRWELVLSAGTGPLEARRFVAALAEVLVVRCQVAGVTVDGQVLSGDAEAPRSLTVVLRGDAERALAGVLGTHALLDDCRRARPGRRRGQRKRWFVSVALRAAELGPEEGAPQLDLREVELRFDRAGGPGGQHVNTCASAVRARHRPTGIMVRVSEGRSQHDNRAVALERLAARLHARELEARRERERERQRVHHRLVRGAAVASWRWGPRRRTLQLVCSGAGRREPRDS